jgi:cholestenol delta-isomerase
MAAGIETKLMESLNTSSSIFVTEHPFYPLEVEIANYLANEWSMQVLLSIFTVLCATIFFGTKYFVSRVHPHLPSTEKAAIWWFVLCMYPN